MEKNKNIEKKLLNFLVEDLKINKIKLKKIKLDNAFSHAYWHWIKSNPEKITVEKLEGIANSLRIKKSKVFKSISRYYRLHLDG